MSPRRLPDDEEDEIDSADDQPEAKRIRRMPSFASVIRGAVLMETIQKICLSLEPIIRKTVHEEVEQSLSQHLHLLSRAPALHIEEDVDKASTSPLKLAFARPLSLPVFTNSKLADSENNPLEIRLVDTRTNCSSLGTSISTHQFGSAVRLEILVLDGDFSCEDSKGWTSDEFSGAIVRAREGKRPLLVGTLTATMNDHGAAKIDDISFTDNSSWIRSRRFRIGVRVQPGSYHHGARIREAVSESFTVKDHRGELYKKNFPPSLGDDTWRLKNIGKEGPIHKRLEAEGIKNVQDFLKLYTSDPEKLKSIVGMSDRQWKVTINHARTCDMGGKCYLFRSEGCDVTLSPIGEVLGATIGDQMYSRQELLPQQIVHVKQLALQAYQHWDQLEEVANGLTPNNLDEAQRLLDSSSWQPSESQESISSGSDQNAKYLDNMGILTSNVTSNVTAAADDGIAMYWNPNMEADSFSWNTTTTSLVWDQMDK